VPHRCRYDNLAGVVTKAHRDLPQGKKDRHPQTVFPQKPEGRKKIARSYRKRSEIGTTIITTNLMPSHWGKVFDSVTASAILDRLSLNGNFVTFEGRSYRSKR
jgi:hypothetical protein